MKSLEFPLLLESTFLPAKKAGLPMIEMLNFHYFLQAFWPVK
jgi:hypothetical protein